MAKKNRTCEHRTKIGNNVYCDVRHNDCGFCTSNVNNCKSAIKVESRVIREYYSFKEGRMVKKGEVS